MNVCKFCKETDDTVKKVKEYWVFSNCCNKCYSKHIDAVFKKAQSNEAKFVTALELYEEEMLFDDHEWSEYMYLKAHVADVLDIRVI